MLKNRALSLAAATRCVVSAALLVTYAWPADAARDLHAYPTLSNRYTSGHSELHDHSAADRVHHFQGGTGSVMALNAGGVDPETPLEISEGDGGVGAQRRLLHGCHRGKSKKPLRWCVAKMAICSRCGFPRSTDKKGHCKKNGKIFPCQRKKAPRNGGSLAGSASQARIGESECPNIHAETRPGHFEQDFEDGIVDYSAGEEYDYFFTSAEDSELIDYDPEGIGADFFDLPRNFWAVDTPEKLQEALMTGTKHIVIVAHLDTTELVPDDGPDPGMAGLTAPVARILPTTLTVAGRCDTPPPESWGLTEPAPPGACGILVKEDFLDAPQGTTCLLLDSLYVAVKQPGPPQGPGHSSVLILHVAGAMWISNSVFQGAGLSSRAIGMNTKYEDTTFTGFTQAHAPGIRMLQKSRLYLDGVTFRDIAIIPPYWPMARLEKILGAGLVLPVGTAITGLSHVLIHSLILSPYRTERNIGSLYDHVRQGARGRCPHRGIQVENNTVFGEPAGNRTVAISPNGTEVLASPRMELWLWPDWDSTKVPDDPVGMSDPDTKFAEEEIVTRLRPEMQQILDIQKEIANEGLREDGFQIAFRRPR